MILKDKRIFVVEDDVKNKAIAQLLLEHAGATVKFDRWGVDTIARLEQFLPVDVILLDLMLPRGVTGFDIFVEIQSHDHLKTIPVVAVSASDTSVAIPQAKNLGFSGFIVKPIDFHNFTKQVAHAIAGNEIWETSGLHFNLR
jgi:CheY-like chemotaxis protein